jgi:hypothetical protein
MPPQQTPTMNPDILKRFMDPSFDPRMEPGFQDPRMPGAGIDPSTGQPMTQQDYDNTLKRYNELLPESQKYFRDFGPPDPNDPTRNEMNVLGQRLEAWQAMPGNAPVYQTMGGGEGPGGFTGQNQDPNFGQLSTVGAGPYGNRGSGQPISQPMGGYQAPGMATWTPAAGVPNGWQAGGIENPFGASGQQPLGSLQSLGGGMSQSGMVNLRGTDGTTQAVPQQDLAHWLSKGAVRI